MIDHVTAPSVRLPRPKTMILLDLSAARRIWRSLHRHVYLDQHDQYWQCLACAETSRRNRPSITHERGCPVPALYARIKAPGPERRKE